MKANYKPKVNPFSAGFLSHMSDREARAWVITEPWRRKEYDDYAYAVELSTLFMLAVEFGFGKERLRRAWEALIRNRVEVRRVLRGQNYELSGTGCNIEDHYMEEELRKRGVDLRAWLDGVTFDQEGNEVTFNETKSG